MARGILNRNKNRNLYFDISWYMYLHKFKYSNLFLPRYLLSFTLAHPHSIAPLVSKRQWLTIAPYKEEFFSYLHVCMEKVFGCNRRHSMSATEARDSNEFGSQFLFWLLGHSNGKFQFSSDHWNGLATSPVCQTLIELLIHIKIKLSNEMQGIQMKSKWSKKKSKRYIWFEIKVSNEIK